LYKIKSFPQKIKSL